MGKNITNKPFTETKRRQMTGEFWKPKRPTTLKQVLTKHCLSENLNPQDFVSWFMKEVAPDVNIELDRREQARYEAKQAFQAKQKIQNLPENRIPNLYLIHKKKPEKLEEIITNYSLEDLFRVRRLCIQNKFVTLLGAAQPEFLSWLNTKISQRVQEGKSDHKGTKEKLRELIFRKS